METDKKEDDEKKKKGNLIHTHTHFGFPCFMGRFHRHNDFTVQTLFSIPLPYPSHKTFLDFQKDNSV